MSLFDSVSKYIQEVKDQVDAKAPSLIAQAKSALEDKVVAIHKAVGVPPPPSLMQTVESQRKENNFSMIQEDDASSVLETLPIAEENPIYVDRSSFEVDLEIMKETSDKEKKSVKLPSLPSMATPTLPTFSQLTSSVFICPDCNSTLTIIESLLPSNKCRVCAQLFCSRCIAKSTLPVPHDILHADFTSPPAAVPLFSSNLSSKTITSIASSSKIDVAKQDEENNQETQSAESRKTTIVANEIQYVCKKTCNARVTRRVMEKFRDQINDSFESHFNDFILHEPVWKEYFPFPETGPEDTAYRQSLRAAQIAVFVADLTGFSLTLKAVKMMYLGSELMNIVVKGDILSVLSPLLESLKSYGIDGPSALLRLYYISCQHSLNAIKNSARPKYPRYYAPREVIRGEKKLLLDRSGVLCPDCPYGVVEYISRYVSLAEVMYMCKLTPPHDTIDYSSWYLTRLLQKQRWTVLMCMHETTKLPDGYKSPAFAVLTRVTSILDKESSNKKMKEAVIVVRGSASPMDWTINLQEAMHDDYQYAYFTPQFTCQQEAKIKQTNGNNYDSNDNLINGNEEYAIEESITVSSGYIHKGIHDSAMAILDGYNLRPHILRLLQSGYEIKCVGHSLGAGVAAMLALEIRNMCVSQMLRESRVEASAYATSVKDNVSCSKKCDIVASPVDVKNDTMAANIQALFNKDKPAACYRPEDENVLLPAALKALWQRVHRVTAVIFACPAILSPSLAEAVLQDRVLINVVHGDDVIPRFSYKTLASLAKELQDPVTEDKATKWFTEDKMDLQDYLTHLGKATDLQRATVASQSDRQTRIQEMLAKTTVSTIVTTADANLDDGLKNSETFAMKAHRTAEEHLSTLKKNMFTFWQANAPVTMQTSTLSTLNANATESYSDIKEANAEIATAPVTGGTFTDKADSTISTDSAAPKISMRDIRQTVTPGPIVHFYREHTGMLKASVVTWSHDLFHKLIILPTTALNDHEMQTYRHAVDAVKFQYLMNRSLHSHIDHQNVKSIKPGIYPVAVNVGREEDALVIRSLIEPDIASHEHETRLSLPPRQHVVSDHATASETSNANTVGHSKHHAHEKEYVKPSLRLQPHGPLEEDELPHSGAMSSTVVTCNTPGAITRMDSQFGVKTMADETEFKDCFENEEEENEKEEEEQEKEEREEDEEDDEEVVCWTACTVCGLDVTWPYMLHSQAARAMVTHHCSVCGQVVCTYCSPSGDIVPGDGLNQTITLKDMRISMPWIGVFAPQRVCLHCYLDSSHPGLAPLNA